MTDSSHGASNPHVDTHIDGQELLEVALDGFFVTDDEQQRSLVSYLADPAFSASPVASESIVELLAFWIADEEYAVDILEIQEIIKLAEVTEVPRAPSCVLGIISLRGTVVPIVDLRVVLNMGRIESTRMSRVLVFRGEGDPVGILVDQVTSVERLERGAIEPKPKTMQIEASEVIGGVGRIDERILIMLDAVAMVGVVDRAL